MDGTDKETGIGGQRVGLPASGSTVFVQVGAMPRLVAHACVAQSIGFEPDKRSWIHKSFDCIGIAFIIAGAGSYQENRRRWRVAGPCMLIQWPQHTYRYGPDVEWEEFYVSYPLTALPHFRTPAWQAVAGPVVPVPSDALLRQACKSIFALVPRLGSFGVIDRIDQLYEQLLLDVLMAARVPANRTLEDQLQEIRTWFDGNYASAVDYDALARRHGLAPRTFRRAWRQRFALAPSDYLAGVRLRRACELLVAGNLPIGEVASLVGFDDPFYFSRRFRDEHGMTPSEFRRRNRHIAQPFKPAAPHRPGP